MSNYEIVLKARLDEAQKRIAELEAVLKEIIEKVSAGFGVAPYIQKIAIEALSEGGADERCDDYYARLKGLKHRSEGGADE